MGGTARIDNFVDERMNAVQSSKEGNPDVDRQIMLSNVQ